MKKILLVLGLGIIMAFGLTGCNGNVINPYECIESPDKDLVDFELVDHNYYGYILVDRNTKVMYYWMGSSSGGITPIYNADGTLKLYDK